MSYRHVRWPSLLILAALMLAGCAMPAQQVVVVVTATPDSAARPNPANAVTSTTTATATPVQPTATTAATVTSQSTATIAGTAIRQPTATKSSTATRLPTATRPATPTPMPSTRVLYSSYLLNAGKIPNILGDKGDILVYTGERMPQGCEMFKVIGLEYTRFGKPMSAPAESDSDAIHGWSVTKQNSDLLDYGVKIHWWYNAGGFASLRIYYVVRQPWNVNCFVPGKMQESP